jgi:hypothetical protein
LKKPYATLATDGGTEFKGVFTKWLYNESIYHKVAEPYRHQQMSSIENVNKQLGRLLNGYMNKMEEETGKVFKEWNDKDVLNTIRTDLNRHRLKQEGNPYTDTYNLHNDRMKPKFKMGDIVYRKSEIPLTALGNKQSTLNFRVGDYRWELQPRKIIKVLPYPEPVSFRYVLNYLPNVSYAEWELKKAPEKEKEEQFVVKEILKAKVINKKKYLLIWWDKFKKADATWEDYEKKSGGSGENDPLRSSLFLSKWA